MFAFLIHSLISATLCERVTLTIDTPHGQRAFNFVLPSTPSLTAPLVVRYHQFQSSCESTDLWEDIEQFAEEDGFYVVTPCSFVGLMGRNGFNAGVCCDGGRDIDELAFFQAILAKTQEEIAARGLKQYDPTDVRVFGVSNGGMMAYRLACQASEHVSRIFSVYGNVVLYPGGQRALDVCQRANNRPVAVAHVHGKEDFVVPFEGSELPMRFPPVWDTLNLWAGLNGCQGDPAEVADRDPQFLPTDRAAHFFQWSSCAKPVELTVVEDWGHNYLDGTGMDCSGYARQFLITSS